MAEKELTKIRVQSLCDTYNNWTTANPMLKKGEIAIVEVPAETGAATTEPTYLLKIGDGVKNFNALGWASGLAADVYPWAKAINAPVASVNGKRGTVQLTASDVNALSASGGILTGTIEGSSASGNTNSTLSMNDDGVYLSFNNDSLDIGRSHIGIILANGEVQIIGSDENGCAPIIGVRTPTQDDEAANKAYVDAQKINNYTITIPSTSWKLTSKGYEYTYSNTNFRASISPIITCTSNTTEYQSITEAEATTGVGITFKINTKTLERPQSSITLQIIELG